MNPKSLAIRVLFLLLSSISLANSDASRICQCHKICRSLEGDAQNRELCERRCFSLCRGSGGERERSPNARDEDHHAYNPYYFDERSYERWAETQHGRFRVLQRFAERSELLRGIAEYRVAVLEAAPRAFLGTITLLSEKNKESYDIKEGDTMVVPSGMIVYLINKHRNEKLRIAMLLRPISIPGRFEEFFGAGGRKPETFYTSFSDEVLEAAFNTPRDRLERLFGQQSKGEIIRASEEQIEALSKSTQGGGGGGGERPFEQSRKPFNVLNKRPSYANNHGQLYEVNANDYRQFQDPNVDVSIANISQGSMMAPNYNSRAIKIAFVVQGSGYMEMACPHISKQKGSRRRGGGESEEEREKEGEEEQEEGPRYQLVKSEVRRGSVFVIPPGHPVVAVASPNENLQVLCFGIRAENNEKFFLAGRNNILKKMEKEAKELAFDVAAREVDEVFNAQQESAFFPGPNQRGGGGRGRGSTSF
ncbi:Vicilin-like antimicrobial peptides 2-2 [Ananas comosus]|uniref:Vicilin-like antimicrobial peptides 2-2 n=1 Tax=Ananas comosus TaxID=4615 RepID=A0A199USS3_ANACO|nr:Vicilin-like antimicrobial peptides 2-2 [Ananas comosus]